MSYTITLQTAEILWLAGLFEGEACFYPQTKKYPLGFSIETTDEDIIQRVCDILGTKYCKPSKRQEHHKQSYKTTLRGRDALEWMQKLYPLMGKRRQEKIKECELSYLQKERGKITKLQVEEIKVLFSTGQKVKELAKKYNISHWRVYQLVRK